MHDVFISYSTKDLTNAEMIRQILEKNKISCWMAPRNIPSGSNYAKEIPAAIKNCKIFLLVLSPNAESSIWVPRELDRAVNNQKVIIPVMIKDFNIGDIFDFYLTGCQRYIAYEQTAEAVYALVKQIYALLGKSFTPAEQIPSSVIPTNIDSSNNHFKPDLTKQNSLHYDGFYYGPVYNDHRDCYRFYPDGKVFAIHISVNISLTILKLMKLENLIGDWGHYDISSYEDLYIETKDFLGKSDVVTGSLEENTLYIDEAFETVEYEFMPFD